VDIVGTKVNNDLFRWMGITSCPKDSDGWHSWILWVNDVIICNTIYRRRRSSQVVVLNILRGESTKKRREMEIYAI
jgi:hypothetical protein